MKESFFNRTFFWWGIYYGIAAVLIFLIEYFVFPSLLGNSFASTIISIFPLVLFMTLAGIAEKKKQGGFLSFGKTFQTMFFTALIGIVIFTIFSHFFNTYYAPEYVTEVYEKEMVKAREKMEDKGMSDEEIEKAMKMTESIFKMKDSIIFKLIGLAVMAGMAAAIALLTALFVRKEPPVNYFNESQIIDKEN